MTTIFCSECGKKCSLGNFRKVCDGKYVHRKCYNRIRRDDI